MIESQLVSPRESRITTKPKPYHNHNYAPAAPLRVSELKLDAVRAGSSGTGPLLSRGPPYGLYV